MDADELEDLQVDADEPDDLQDYVEEDRGNTQGCYPHAEKTKGGSNTQGCYPHVEKIDDALDASDDESGANTQECSPRRKKNGSGLAGRILSALMISASTIADAAQQSWTNAVRRGRVDLAEVCCTADSQLAGEVIIKGGTAHRYSHWNGYDLTARKARMRSAPDWRALVRGRSGCRLLAFQIPRCRT